MNDMGPRRGMDGFARPVRPAGAPSMQPQPRPVAQPGPQMRPVAPRPMAQPAVPRPMAYQAQPQRDPRDPRQQRPEAAPEQQRRPRPAKRSRGGGSSGWKVFLQFVVGLLVIAGVAAAIVALYIRYYQ